MNERQKRLIEVYEHLRRYFGIHTKTGFAEAIEYGRTSMSAAMNGDEKYLTDSLFKNICDTYKGVFDLNYLLTGEGQLLTIEEEVKSEDIEKTYKQIHKDHHWLESMWYKHFLPEYHIPRYQFDYLMVQQVLSQKFQWLDVQLPLHFHQ